MPTTNKKISILWVFFAVAAILFLLPLIINVITVLRQGVNGQYWPFALQVLTQLFQPILLSIVAWELKKGSNSSIFCVAVFLALWNSILPLLNLVTAGITPGFAVIFAQLKSLPFVSGYFQFTFIVLNMLVNAVAAITLLQSDVRSHFKHEH